MFRRKCKITFIAHGLTIYSEENRISDVENYPPLNDVGYEEINKIADFIKRRGLKNDKIYTSPALRTVQSANIISKALKKDFEVLSELTSRKYGNWSGLTYDQIEVKYPQMLEKFHENPCSFFPDGGEAILDFNQKVDKIISEVVENHIRGRILIVTYPAVIQAAICNALNIPPENQAKIYIKTGSATQISYFESWASLLYSGYTPL